MDRTEWQRPQWLIDALADSAATARRGQRQVILACIGSSVLAGLLGLVLAILN